MPPRVSIIILQYNNSQDTVRCLESVGELDYPDSEVIIVDNASKLEHLNNVRLFIENRPQNEKFELLANEENLGYSGGNNIGIKTVLESGAEYVLILNPDSAVEKELLSKLVEKIRADPEIGIAGPSISEQSAGRHNIVYGGLVEWLKPELRHLRSYLPDKYFFVPGAAMLVRKEIFEKIGLFDERYFLYFEDADFCVRARKAGFRLAIVPEAVLYHKASSSASLLGVPLLLYYHFRNSLLFNAKNGPLWVKLALPFWSVFIIIKQLFKIIFMPAKRGISRAILAGVTDFYKGKFGKLN